MKNIKTFSDFHSVNEGRISKAQVQDVLRDRLDNGTALDKIAARLHLKLDDVEKIVKLGSGAKYIETDEIVKMVNESANHISVAKGQKVSVKMMYFKDQPVYEVEAHGDSWMNENGTHVFSFLSGGDMMMIAQYDSENNYWYSK